MLGVATVAALGQAATPASLIVRVGEYVEQYYSRAQSILAVEEVTVQPLARDLGFDGFARRLVYEIRVEWDPEAAETANVVRIGKVIPQADDHPTPKPEALIKHFMRLHGKAGDVLLDPFMGHGPTLRVAKDMGITAIGIEVDEEFCEFAAKRLSQGALAFGEMSA